MNSEIGKAIKEMEAALSILRAVAKDETPPIRTVKVGDLEWQANVPDEEFTWEEAKAYAASLGDGWRLPTIKELLTLVDYGRKSPACIVFPDCPCDWFWSSSPVSGHATRAWGVYFTSGVTDYSGVSSTYRVRCVR